MRRHGKSFCLWAHAFLSYRTNAPGFTLSLIGDEVTLLRAGPMIGQMRLT